MHPVVSLFPAGKECIKPLICTEKSSWHHAVGRQLWSWDCPWPDCIFIWNGPSWAFCEYCTDPQNVSSISADVMQQWRISKVLTRLGIYQQGTLLPLFVTLTISLLCPHIYLQSLLYFEYSDGLECSVFRIPYNTFCNFFPYIHLVSTLVLLTDVNNTFMQMQVRMMTSPALLSKVFCK